MAAMIWKRVKTKFWSLVWFFLVPASISVAVEVTLVRSGVFIEVAPWRLLLMVALAAFTLLFFKRHLPFWYDEELEEIALRKKMRKEAEQIVRRLTRFARNRGGEDAEAARREAANIEKALQEDNFKKLRDALEKVRSAGLPRGALPSQNQVVELIKIFGTAIVLAILLRAFIVEPFRIPTGSMIPTLQIGDHIFVTKFSYGIKVPYFGAGPYFWKMPRRGDVIVFRPPHDPQKNFIKRVIGIPGDVIEIRNSNLYVNDVPLPRCKIDWADYDDRDEDSGWKTQSGILFLEKLGKLYYLTMNKPYPISWAPERVEEGTVFVMGDNRYNSDDSRAWGGVPFNNIKGGGKVIWWSNGPGPSLRVERMGHRIMGLPQVEARLEGPLRKCLEKLKNAKTVPN